MKTRTSLLVMLISVILSVKVFSSTILVTTGNDNGSGSLREAIINAQSGDTIIFDQSLLEIKLASQIVINKSITISGNPGLKIYSTSDMPRIFQVSSTSNLITIHISNLLLKAISLNIVSVTMDGGIMLIDNQKSIVAIDNCYFTYNAGSGYVDYKKRHGGGIAIYNGSVKINNSTFSGLETSHNSGSAGGAIYQKSGDLTLINCTFCGNSSANGTAVYTLNSKLDITSCTFADNRHYEFLSSGQAVAIFYSDVDVRNSIFNDNQSEIYGTITSGGYNVFPSKYTLTYCTILGDTVTNKYCTGNFYYSTNGYVIMAENEFWIPTCAIKSTSCCIDALPSDGNGAPTYDERGFVRLNNSDIGAFEYGGIVPTLEVSTTELTIGALANSTKTFDITSNTSWSVISNQTWLTVSSPTGYNNTTITLTAQANPTTLTRVAIVTVSGENVTSKIITVTQDAGTSGILDNENRNFLIYPNPTNNFLYIDSSINKASIIIIDINGKFLLSRNEITDNKIDISRLQNGLYTLKIETDKGIIVRKFLKIN